MKRQFYLVAGLASLALGSIGVLLPLLPTVPFMILAAFCFANSSPRLESWLVEHHVFGTHIKNWRDRRAITRRGKWAATVAFAVSCVCQIALESYSHCCGAHQWQLDMDPQRA